MLPSSPLPALSLRWAADTGISTPALAMRCAADIGISTVMHSVLSGGRLGCGRATWPCSGGHASEGCKCPGGRFMGEHSRVWSRGQL